MRSSYGHRCDRVTLNLPNDFSRIWDRLQHTVNLGSTEPVNDSATAPHDELSNFRVATIFVFIFGAPEACSLTGRAAAGQDKVAAPTSIREHG
jgi:hypothetical protein